jgi:hypothetical protein
MYARHPNTDWGTDQEFPLFEKISSNQSFNWSAYSIPTWARFTDQQEFRYNYGVAGYYVKTIREAHKLKQDVLENSYGLKHDPNSNNYSHCVLYPDEIPKNNKKLKRAYRATLKHKIKRSIYPNTDRKTILRYFDYFGMFIHRVAVLIKKYYLFVRK